MEKFIIKKVNWFWKLLYMHLCCVKKNGKQKIRDCLGPFHINCPFAICWVLLNNYIWMIDSSLVMLILLKNLDFSCKHSIPTLLFKSWALCTEYIFKKTFRTGYVALSLFISLHAPESTYSHGYSDMTRHYSRTAWDNLCDTHYQQPGNSTI